MIVFFGVFQNPLNGFKAYMLSKRKLIQKCPSRFHQQANADPRLINGCGERNRGRDYDNRK